MKKGPLAYTRYAEHACELLGLMIREARIDRSMTVIELAQRVGVSRGLIQRIERGDKRCALGTVFEAAAVLGVRLFSRDESGVRREISTIREKLSLLPSRVVSRKSTVDDNF